MDVNNKKRPRSQNWDEIEKAFLLDLVKADINILENKKKNIYNKDKFAAWEHIRQKMDVEGYPRDIKRIKEQCQRMKVQAKRNISIYRKSFKQTGGGPPIPEPTEIEWKIKDFLPYEFSEDYSPFDCDSVTKNVSESTEPSANVCGSSTSTHEEVLYGDHSYSQLPMNDTVLSANNIAEEVVIDDMLESEGHENIEVSES
ncbi:hypothetical protein NQ314_006923 [Rhamnusium bicolor]|uniref:Regulatory protein zeste n=2 Tax=Rhamnusium bicolor TaxID=1586634 RepID=A0AAV8YU96_9CUCU|nr:hypothetical protein NQ314_006923 [Rhamnusium bicolor]